MPLVFVQRYRPAIIPGVGTQYVAGNLTLGNPTIVEFDPSIFNYATYGAPTTFTIFQYGGTLTGSESNLSAVLSGTGYSTAVFTHDATAKTISVTLS